MVQHSETRISSVRIRQRQISGEIIDALPVEEPKRKWFRADDMLKNIGVASAFVLCAVFLRSGALPVLDRTTDAILAAATDHSLLDDQLGKLSFVSALFPEAVLVFGENSSTPLLLPVSNEQITHAWSEQEPYTAWISDEGVVTAAADGEVTGVYHGNGDERIVRIMNAEGLTCTYGNLETVKVHIGDEVTTGEVVGTLLQGNEFVFEVEKNGVSIDPEVYLSR